jgi:RNA polymerase-binding transcription factor DksA
MSLERQPDKFDRASDLEALQRDNAIKAVQRNLKESHPDFDGESCLDCADLIPPLRLAMCRIRCVSCQAALEHQNKLRRR